MSTVLLINGTALAAIAIVGFVISVWYARYDNLEVI